MTWLVLDVNYLCHRAYHTTGELTHNDIATGVIYGVLRDIVNFQDMFNTERIIFVFDAGNGLREAAVPSYKETRRKNKADLPASERLKYMELIDQIHKLRDVYLPRLGYKNIFSYEGYEGDDIIAVLCDDVLPKTDQVVIVSSDKDLYQLLDGRITIYSPQAKHPMTLQTFFAKWQINPLQWPRVKAMAGCDTDDVEGIEGIGEITAAKFIRGVLGEKTEAYKKIIAGESVWRANLPLVRLPYPGCPTPVLQTDTPMTAAGWAAVADELGLASLRQNPPRSARAARVGLADGTS